MKTSRFGRKWTLCLAATLLLGAAGRAQTPPPPAKRLPPAGIALSAADRAELTAGAAALRAEIDAALVASAIPTCRPAEPDVEIYWKSSRLGLAV